MLTLAWCLHIRVIPFVVLGADFLCCQVVVPHCRYACLNTYHFVVQTTHILKGRTHMKLLQRALAGWQLHHTYQQKKVAASQYAAACLESKVLRSWAGIATEGMGREQRAWQVYTQVSSRFNNQKAHAAFSRWRLHAKQQKVSTSAELS